VRITLGVIFFMHGGQKVLGWFGGGGLAATVTGMTGMGLPAPAVYAVCFGEFLGGIGLIVGCLSRVAAAGVTIIMVGAVVFVHWKNGFFINWFMVPDKGHGFEYNLALIGMGLAIVLGGPGKCAIDNCCCKKKGMC
jgi:putative oxidoreductase